MFAEMLTKQTAESERRMVQMLQMFQIRSKTTSIPKFESFRPETELFKYYMKRFERFLLANSVARSKAAHVILTNQNPEIYKTLQTFALQLQPPRNVNDLNYYQIVLNILKKLFNRETFAISERYKFWSNGKMRVCTKALNSDSSMGGHMRFFKNYQLDSEALRTNFIYIYIFIQYTN